MRDFPGSLSDYRTYVNTFFTGSEEKTGNKEQISIQDEKELRIKERDTRKRLRRVVERLEREISSHEEMLLELKAVLENPENSLNHQLLHETTLKVKSLRAALEDLLKDWEAKQIELEIINQP